MTIDIFNIPLYYINFTKNTILENQLKTVGFTNVNHFQSVDGKKFEPKQLLDDNMITLRSYYDLIGQRSEHAGLSSLGAVGCTLSHYSLWKMCIEKNLPYITIVENDVLFNNPITSSDIKFINETITKPNGIFISSNIIQDRSTYYFIGLQFYISSNTACEKMVKSAFPIDVQTDWYISGLATRNEVDINGYIIATQQLHKSDIQDICITCNLPRNGWFYFSIILIIFIIIILGVYYYKINKKCKQNLITCDKKLKLCENEK